MMTYFSALPGMGILIKHILNKKIHSVLETACGSAGTQFFSKKTVMP